MVGGLPAAMADNYAVIIEWAPWVVAAVIGGAFLVLLIAFKSVLIPIKAIFLNLLSVGAAFGVMQFILVEDHWASFFGLAAVPDAVLPMIPLLVFCTVFGISMDYEVFMISRIDEARRRGAGNRDAVTEGVAQTGGLITSAAAIMIAVFGAFAFGKFMPIQMLGFSLAAAILIDATLIRGALGPALLHLAGRWNWWPGDRGRRDEDRE